MTFTTVMVNLEAELRKRVDTKIYSDLVNKAGMNEWTASAFLEAVRIGGAEVFGLSFSWGFAHKLL